MPRMPGQKVDDAWEEEWSPLDGRAAREPSDYQPQITPKDIAQDRTDRAPNETINPFEQYLHTDEPKAQEVEPGRDLGDRFYQHWLNSMYGGTAGIMEATTLLNESDPATRDAMLAERNWRIQQFENMPPAESGLENLIAVGGGLLGGVTDPLSATPMLRVGSAGWRAARPLTSRVIDQSLTGALLNGTANSVLQGVEVEAELRDEYDPWEAAIQTAIGGVGGAPFGMIEGHFAKDAIDKIHLAEGLGRAPEPGKAVRAPGGKQPVKTTDRVGPEPELVDREQVLADEFLAERGLTREQVEAMEPDQGTALISEWANYRDRRLAEPEAPTVEGVTREFGPEKLSEAQETLFGEVIGTRNLTPEQLAQVEDHLLGGKKDVPQGPVETEGAAPVNAESIPNPPLSTGPSPVPTGPFRVFKPGELKVDAKRFQFKEGGDAAGVTDRLKGVKNWDPTKAGQTLVWEDNAGNFYIADGHQRHGLGSRLEGEGQNVNIPAYVIREADGVSAEDARVIAAAKNIAEGTGSAIDAAKILRTRPDMGVDLPPSSALVRDANGLAKLSDDGFGMVVNKKVPAGYAAIVGKLAPDKGTHGDLLELLAKEKPENAIEAESMIRDALDAPVVQSTMEDMFGTAEVTQILFKERAQVLSAAATAIRKNRAAFSTLVREEQRLTAGGNKLATEANLERATQDAEILAHLQAEARRKGPIADALAEAAQRLKAGEPRATVVRDFTDRLRGKAPATGPDGRNAGPQVSQGEQIAASLEQPLRPEALPDRLEAHATALADFLERESLLPKGPGAVDIPAPVVRHVLGVVENRDVLRAVIRLLPVDVMDFLTRQKRPPQLFLGNETMLKNMLSADGKAAVALGVDKAAQLSLVRAVADAATEIARATRGALKEQSASLTGAGDSVSGGHLRVTLPDGAVVSIGFGNKQADPRISFSPAQRSAVVQTEPPIKGLKVEEEAVGLYAFMVDGEKIGWARVAGHGALDWIEMVQVSDAYRRKGVASWAYGEIEKQLGRPLKQGATQTEAGKGLWRKIGTEAGAEGKPQLVIPGAERAGPATMAQRAADAPLRAGKSQKPMDFGLFGDEADQLDLLDMARQKIVPRLRQQFDAIDWRPDGAHRSISIGSTSLIYSVTPDGVEISSMHTPQALRGKGSARAAMEVFIEGADALNLNVRLYAAGLDRKTETTKLLKFYERLGFQDTGSRVNGAVEMIRMPDPRETAFDDAGLNKLINDNAPIEEISQHPLVLDAIRRMETLPRTHEREGYGSDIDRATRRFDFDGEVVIGVDNAVDRLTRGALDFSPHGPVRQEAKATVLMGPAAAGKSTIAEKMAAAKFAAIVDPDEAKKVLPEFDRGIGANAVHEESSDIGNEVLRRLVDTRHNIILPKVGANPDGIEKLVIALQRQGYHVEVVNLAVSYDNAFRRMVNRFLKTGRLIDPKYVEFVGTKPADTYRTLKEKGVADGYAEIDGNGPYGQDADIIDEIGQALQGVPGFRRDGLTQDSPNARPTSGRERAPAAATESIAARLRPQQQSPVPTNRAQAGARGTGAAERLEDLSAELADLVSMNVPVRQGRLKSFKGGKAAGQFDRSQGVIRMREMSDFETQTHETAHALEAEYGRDLAAMTGAHAAELQPLAYVGAAKNQLTSEGFAEWMRFYVSNPSYTTRVAPQFTAAFEAFLRQRNPEQFRRLQNVAQRYRNWTVAPSGAAITADIVSTRRRGMISDSVTEMRHNGIQATLGRYMDKLYTATIDRAHPLNRMVDELKKVHEAKTGHGLDLKAAEDPYKLARLFPDAQSRGHMDLMHGVLRHGSTVRDGPGLADALEVALGKQYRNWSEDQLAEFAAYLVSRRAFKEYDRYFNGEIPNVPGKFTQGDYKVAMDEFEAAHPEWMQAADMVYEWNRNMLAKKADAGFITREAFNDLIQREDYVPFQRDLTDLDKEVLSDAPMGRTLKQSLLRQFRGSKRSVINPIESMAKDAYNTNVLIAQNDIAKAIDDLARNVGVGAGAFVERIANRELKGTTVGVEEVLRDAAKAAGLQPQDIDQLTTSVGNLLGADANANVFRMVDTNEKGEPIIYVWRDGRRSALRLADGEFGKEVYQSLSGLNKELQGMWTAIASLPATTVRYGITTSPPFVLANFIRDQVSAWVLTGDGFIPFISGAAGLRDELVQGEITRAYNSFGGIMGGGNVAALDRARAERDIRALQKQGYAIKRFASFRGFAELTELTETGTRLALFKNAFRRGRKDGLSDYEAAVEAAYTSRDYIDFGRHGSRMLAARRLVPFLNASLQGLDKTLRTTITPWVKLRTGRPLSAQDKRNLATSAKAWMKMTTVGLAGLALSNLYRDDPEYEEISDYLRATHWMVKLGDGKWAAIMKPFELGFVSNLFERSFEAIYKKDPTAMGRFVEGLYEQTAPPFLGALLSGDPGRAMKDIPVIGTVVEIKTNRNLDTGRPIVPEHMLGLNPALQYTAYTSDMARTLGEAVNISPAIIDHAISGWGGSWGSIIQRGSTDLANEEGIGTTIANSVARRFVREAARGGTSAREFWNRIGSTTGTMARVSNTYSNLLKNAGQSEASAFLETQNEDDKAYSLLNAHFEAEAKRLHPLRRAQDAIGVISQVRKEIAGQKFTRLEDKEDKDLDPADREMITLTPSQRQTAQDMLGKIEMVEARNALIAIGATGWAQREPMDLVSLNRDLEIAMPEVYEEVIARMEAEKVYDAQAVADSWPDVKERILTERQDANFDDLIAGAQ